MNATVTVRRGAVSKVEAIEREHGTPIKDLLLRMYQQGMNQYQIAKALGVSQSTVCQYTRRAEIKVSIVRHIEGQD